MDAKAARLVGLIRGWVARRRKPSGVLTPPASETQRELAARFAAKKAELEEVGLLPKPDQTPPRRTP